MNLPLHIALVVTGQISLPGRPDHARPQTATDPGYLEFLEQNSHIIYPVIGILVLVLIAAGILQAWRTQDLDGLAKAELKREVILEIRRQMGGVTAEDLARAVGLEAFRMNRLLEEMQRDGLLISHTNTTRKMVWRMKGTGGPTHGARPRRSASRR
jgi:predicted transcriptional regulator